MAAERRRHVLGVGLSSAAAPSEVAAVAAEVLAAAGVGWDDVAAVATLDRLAGDARLGSLGPPVVGVGAEALAGVAGTAASERVRTATGTPSVAEAAALAVAGPGGSLVVGRRAGARVTAALAVGGPA